MEPMKRTVVLKQAKTFAALLPTLMRQLMAGVNGPAVQLPLAQLRVCSILSDGPRSMSDLSRELAVSLSAMTQIADRLERAKLVKRVATANDRRIRRLQLTDRGKRVMQLHETARVDRVLAVFERPDAENEKTGPRPRWRRCSARAWRQENKMGIPTGALPVLRQSKVIG